MTKNRIRLILILLTIAVVLVFTVPLAIEVASEHRDVPGKTEFEDEEFKALAELAWAEVQRAIADEGAVDPGGLLALGLRGNVYFGPVLEGTVGGKVERRKKGYGAERRFFAYFPEIDGERAGERGDVKASLTGGGR